MISHTTQRFRAALERLPERVRRQARQGYLLFQQNPQHPSLHFKPVHPNRPVYSVRIGSDYRALGALDGDEMLWFWIGTHNDYDRVIDAR